MQESWKSHGIFFSMSLQTLPTNQLYVGKLSSQSASQFNQLTKQPNDLYWQTIKPVSQPIQPTNQTTKRPLLASKVIF